MTNKEWAQELYKLCHDAVLLNYEQAKYKTEIKGDFIIIGDKGNFVVKESGAYDCIGKVKFMISEKEYVEYIEGK